MYEPPFVILVLKMLVGPASHGVKCLVCQFWATVETWWSNMGGLPGRGTAPYVDMKGLL